MVGRMLSVYTEDSINFVQLTMIRRSGEKMTLMLVRKHLDEVKCIDSRLMDLDPIFLSGIVSAQKLLFWLRDSLPDDDEFENRIQVAMGTWCSPMLERI